MNNIAKEIKYIQAFGLSASFIGGVVGITQQHVNILAKNGADPKLSTAEKILLLAAAVRELDKAAKAIKALKKPKPSR